MFGLRAVLPLSLLVLACSADGSMMPDEEKGDLAADGSALRCVVVEVMDSGVLEEGLGSIYDFDEDGFPNVDGDSLEVTLETSSFSEIDSGLMFDVGQMTVGFEPTDTITRVDEGDEITAWEATNADAAMTFRVRVFNETQLGWVFTVEGSEAKPLAKIDCRAGVSVPDAFM